MSIKAEITNRVYERRLAVFTQIMPRLPDRREIYLSPEIKQEIDGSRRNRVINRRFGHARALLETFVRGDMIVARWPPDKDVTAMMALLDPADKNVWEFRIGQPRPGLRIFGRFAAKDIFIGTHYYQREDLPEGEWTQEIKLCCHAWNSLFPAYLPLNGTGIHDFISNARLPP